MTDSLVILCPFPGILAKDSFDFTVFKRSVKEKFIDLCVRRAIKGKGAIFLGIYLH